MGQIKKSEESCHSEMSKPKKIFLSFKPDFFRPILYGIKKYEYRKRFINEETIAYLYLSSPVQELIGIMELGVPILIESIIDNYERNDIIYKRLCANIENGEKFAIPIKSLQLLKKPIGIKTIKEIEPSFFPPQSYLYIEKKEDLYQYLKKQEYYKSEFINKIDDIDKDNIGCTCKEMENMEIFKKQDDKFISNKKYDIIKSGYLLSENNKLG